MRREITNAETGELIEIIEHDDPPADIVAAAAESLARRIASGTVSVITSAGTHTYGIDEATQANIQKALLGVALGLTPNPRQWTPKGALAPISVTHDDLKAIGAAIGSAVDATVQAYLAVKAAVLTGAITRIEQVDAQSWPA